MQKEDEVCCKRCSAQCKQLQTGECQHLSVNEIEILLDKTDWDDLDKGEVLHPYILRELPEENRKIKNCDHSDFVVEKYPVGCGYYGHCQECGLAGKYANTKEEALYNFNNSVKEKQS